VDFIEKKGKTKENKKTCLVEAGEKSRTGKKLSKIDFSSQKEIFF
jgi:hypothetical protein